jgi:VIT1/CCC1 family predicted Fe2+/Mn2+ transporter
MVLGANDGIVSTACLVLGVAAAQSEAGPILTAGIAGLVAGALSMAVGEWVSVGSQHDTEEADIARERWELANLAEREREELVQIYADKGLSRDLAQKVADELTEKNALGVHLSEELGISEATRARPMQAALSSAAAFALGAALPLMAVALSPAAWRLWMTAAVSVIALAALGALGARLGGAPMTRATVRVVLGGLAAMAITMGIGHLVGVGLA